GLHQDRVPHPAGHAADFAPRKGDGLDYRYWADGQAYEDSQRLGSYTNIRKGDSVAVCYLPDDPARSRLARDSTKNLKIKRRGLLRRH
ncbi:MAG: hypothetical protein K2I62_03795, partial [Alistipes sp.]|nr:hypothetical protein [Alistipes sp.]